MVAEGKCGEDKRYHDKIRGISTREGHVDHDMILTGYYNVCNCSEIMNIGVALLIDLVAGIRLSQSA